MSENKMLNQEEIDALLNATPTDEQISNDHSKNREVEQPQNNIIAQKNYILNDDEIDALGEIGNISMGSAATTLSELLGQRVNITSPKVTVTTQDELLKTFGAPFMIIQIEYKSGLEGTSVLAIQLKDAILMANLMMGGDGTGLPEEIGEIEVSAASEAMNQMIGTGSTSLASVFGRSINISPPITKILKDPLTANFRFPGGENVVVISFDMKIGDLLDTQIMQVLSVETAKREAAMLWQSLMGASNEIDSSFPDMQFKEDEKVEEDDSWLSKDLWLSGEINEENNVSENEDTDVLRQEHNPSETLSGLVHQTDQDGFMPVQFKQENVSGSSFTGLSPTEQRKLELLLDVPLKVTVVLGRTKRPIKEVLNLTPGAIVELNSLVDEPVEILVNGTLVAKGEVVVVNENFGVRIINIISPEERLKHLK